MSFLDTNLKINGLLYRKKRKLSESYELFCKIMSEMAHKIIPGLYLFLEEKSKSSFCNHSQV